MRTNYESRLMEEIGAVQSTEKELSKMARMEMELIAHLQRKQAEQREAYLELEQALGLAPNVDGGVRTTAELEVAMAAMYRQHGEAAPPGGGLSHSHPGGGAQGGPQPGGAPGEPSEEEVAAAFARFDAEGAGTIPTPALEGLMLALGLRLNGAQLAQARQQQDRAGAGSISYEEFLLWWRG